MRESSLAQTMRRLLVPGLAGALAFLLGGPAVPAHAASYSFRVKHLHTFGGCQGVLTINDDEIRYATDARADARIWLYPDVKKVERKGSRRLVVHTHEDQALQFGRDKPFEFHFLDGVISQEVFQFLIVRAGRPGTQPPAAPPGGRYELAAKHLHIFGGCQGTLRITDSHIEFLSDRRKDSRLWKYLDLKRLRHDSAYQLSLATYEDQAAFIGRDKTFNFALKEPLEPAVLEFIRSRLNR